MVKGDPVIYHSRYANPAIPDDNVPDYVLGNAARFGDHPALVDGVSGEAVSYRDLSARVGVAAGELSGAGIRGGDAVAVMGPNQPAWAIGFYAVLTAGGAVVPVNPTLTVGEIVKQLQLSGVSNLIADGSVLDKAQEAAALAGAAVLELDGLTGGCRHIGQDHAGARPTTAGARSGATAVIASSSGTTGQPKGVMLTHRNLVATLCQHEGIYHVDTDDVVLAALPFFHIYGMSIVLNYAVRHGATVVTLPRFSLQRYLSLIAEHRVTWLHLAPPIVLLLASPEAQGADLSSVRHAVSGAAPLDHSVSTRAAARLGCSIGQGYGMTEASPGVTWVPDDGSVECPPGSVGVLVAGTEARIVDPTTGEDADGSGELWVRGPQVMTGYLGDPAATAATVGEDGWLRTGDIVRVDDAGVWWVVARLKELIKYKGHQVAPAELEGILLDHPAVVDAAVIGLPDLAAGEIPKAYVVAATPLSEEELLAWVADRVAPYKKIRVVEFVKAIPKSASGKILRRQLKMQEAAPAASVPQYSSDEMMTAAAARTLSDNKVCFVGIGLPSAAANLARATHAPNVVLVYESGTIGAKPTRLPLSIGDGELAETADAVVSVAEIFNYWLQGGRIDVGFLSAAQIDRYANLNSTVIGPYDNPTVRLPGAGGAPEIAASCKEVVIVIRQNLRTFVRELDFVTSVGHGKGPSDRERLGLTGAGPSLVITDLGLLRPHPETLELELTHLHPGVSIDTAQAATGWDLAISGELRRTEPPTHHELEVLRRLVAAR